MKALVLGAAVSGKPAVRLLSRLGIEAHVYDVRAEAVAELREDGFAVHSGEWNPRHLAEVDLVVTSPGVPEHTAPIQDALASGVPIWSELELGSRHLDAPMVAVTGTNGKTTVTRLITEMLQEAGVVATSAGNIGNPLTGLILESRQWEVVVVEASSFQLRFIEDFHPAVAVILNVAADHLDWHGSAAAYLAAKANIWRNQGPDDVLVFDADDAGAIAAVDGAPARLVPISTGFRPEGGAGVADGRLWFRDDSVDLDSVPEIDGAFLTDLAAAAAAAAEMGATAAAIATAIKRFDAGEHRRQLVGEWGGVAWVNDSKATNPHAALASAGAYDSVVLIAGGRNKGLDLSALPRMPGVKHTYALGEAATELLAAGGDRVTVVMDLDEAVAAADAAAAPGDTVLLAPGCASFDMFDSYEQRGAAFASAVRRRKEGS